MRTAPAPLFLGPDRERPIIAVTTGEPAGIGPDVCLIMARRRRSARIVLIGDRDLLEARARQLGLVMTFRDFDPARLPRARDVEIEHVAAAYPVRPGVLDPRNSGYVLALLDHAIDGCLGGRFAAVATAPIHKGVINDAGIAFTGHTEYFAARTGVSQPVMMLAGNGLRVALATTHLALQDVPRAITRERLGAVIRVLCADLTLRFGIARPRVIVAGLNPHAGESGHLGREEIEVITPVLEALRDEGFDLIGPIPADTLFNPARLSGTDCVLAMFHDQGLPVLKYATFGEGVNITLGLPLIRTSVDHGTALELAGTGRARADSLIEAVELAAQMAAQHSPR